MIQKTLDEMFHYGVDAAPAPVAAAPVAAAPVAAAPIAAAPVAAALVMNSFVITIGSYVINERIVNLYDIDFVKTPLQPQIDTYIFDSVSNEPANSQLLNSRDTFSVNLNKNTNTITVTRTDTVSGGWRQNLQLTVYYKLPTDVAAVEVEVEEYDPTWIDWTDTRNQNSTVVRYNTDNKVECASADGTNCYWNTKIAAEVNTMVQTELNPTVCVPDQYRSNHWCGMFDSINKNLYVKTWRYVRLYREKTLEDHPMNIGGCEVYVNGTDIARGKIVTQRAPYRVTGQSQSDPDYYPSRNLVDGNKNTFAHTINEPIEWFMIDLGLQQPINNIVIFNRKGGNGRYRFRSEGMVIQLSKTRDMASAMTSPLVLGNQAQFQNISWIPGASSPLVVTL